MTGKEVEPKKSLELTYKERDAALDKKLGPEFSVDKSLEEGRQQIKEAAEYRTLIRWFTDVMDELASDAPGHTDAQVTAWCRIEVRKRYAKKWARLLELEDHVCVANAKHQAAATTAHLTMVKQGLRW